MPSNIFFVDQSRTPATVERKGLVGPCERIEAHGDIIVHGSVHDAELISRLGHIRVLGDVIGTGKAVLQAAGDIFVQFAHNSVLEAKGRIISVHGFDGCRVRANEIETSDAHAKVRASTLSANRTILVKDVGEMGGTKTILELAHPENDPLVLELNELKKLEEKLGLQLSWPRRRVTKMSQSMRSNGVVGERTNQEFHAVVDEYLQVSGKLEYTRKRIISLEQRLFGGLDQGGRIEVRGTAYPGVFLSAFGRQEIITKSRSDFALMPASTGTP